MSIEGIKVRLACVKAVLFHEDFIVVTDREGHMGLTIDTSATDAIAIANMRSSLVHFKQNVTDTIREFDAIVDKELGAKARKKGRKIEVTEK